MSAVTRDRDSARRGGRERVLERVRVLAARRDVDLHLTGKPRKLIRTRSGRDDDVEIRHALRHRRVVREHETAATAVQRAGDALDGDVAGGAFDGRAGR